VGVEADGRQETFQSGLPRSSLHRFLFRHSEHISSLLVTGGQDDTGKSLEDFFILSVRDWKWKKIVIQKQPTPRHQHCLLPLSTVSPT
jgi:hypothetical protein